MPQIKVVNVTIPGGTSGDYTITGAGFTPGALIFFRRPTSDTTDTGATEYFFGAATTSAQFSTGYVSVDYNGSATRAWSHTSHLLYRQATDGTTQFDGTLKSFNSDGCVINISTAYANDITCTFVFFSADIGAVVGTTSITSSGNKDYNVGFNPSGVITAFLVDNRQGTFSAIGVASEDGTVIGIGANAQNDGQSVSWVRRDKIIALYGATQTDVTQYADSLGFSMITNGFRFVAADNTGAFGSRNFGYIAFPKTIDFYIGITGFTSTDVNTNKSVTDSPFAPMAIATLPIQDNTSTATLYTNNMWSGLGFYDGSTIASHSQFHGSADGGTSPGYTNKHARKGSTENIMMLITTNTSTQWRANLLGTGNGLTSNGFVYQVVQAPFAANWAYVAFGIRKFTLSVPDLAHTQLLDAIAVTQKQSISVADLLQSQTLDSVFVTQKHALLANDLSHAHLLDSVTTIRNDTLIVADVLHLHTLEGTDVHPSGVDDLLHAHTLDSVTLTQKHVLAVNDALHTHALEAISISQKHLLTDVLDLYHSQGLDPVTLTQAHFLAVQELLQGQTVDNAILVQRHVLDVADALQGHALEEGSVYTLTPLVVQDLHHDQIIHATLVQVWKKRKPVMARVDIKLPRVIFMDSKPRTEVSASQGKPRIGHQSDRNPLVVDKSQKPRLKDFPK